ncbi:helix-turn-helix domain-containing protein [Chryseobacterium joostei]|uniref:Helix-turn-helix domain-containing protein n=1 Tax=Chryseobacterium joostei TaxID=112234 RepID=A0A1N7IME2_9FLAO|nr:helix-turn-helix domain-containing protein [Chryseobacterium joostei]AZA98493.1 helix-turn-helix domain-containing protein [Chryseobacterium joostei]SIS38240.1 Helix-turn-helix domain-containing protein [Chryseobacterium joostei]
MKKRITGFFLFFLVAVLQAQDFYSVLRDKYWEYDENDTRAFSFINLAISTAKKEKNYAELYQAYKDGIFFSPDRKLKYADSAIVAAKLSKNEDLIGNAYISKGVIYYFNHKKFQLALDEYLKAYHYTQNTKDQFLKYQNLYHIGVVKSYLGHYQEALPIFQQCLDYFEPNTRANIHSNLIYNNQKGYLNTLHQIIICYQSLGKHKEAQKLVNEGLHKIPKDKSFYLEKSYFEKSKGISDFQQKKYENAIRNFDLALPGLMKIDDFAWISVIYFYKGQSFQKLSKDQLALENYKKVDSIFNKHQFILPELRKNYDELINYYKKYNDPKQELYYTRQLLKADKLISNDFKYLSTRIHKDYDEKALLDTKVNLEHRNSYGKYLLILSGVLILVLVFILHSRSKSKKEVQRKYERLLFKINSINITKEKEIKERTFKMDSKLLKKLNQNFSEFEKCNGFLEKGLTAGKLAANFETNTSYLSQYINEFKQSNFNTYINKLRIEYATEKICNDKNWVKYSVEDLAEACGFSNRQSFSNIFYEQNGIRPQDFLKTRREKNNL